MKNILKRMMICGLMAITCWSVFLISDRNKLNNGLIRFHVVANSDSEEDQSIKLQIRDAVLKSMEADLRKISDIREARNYLQQQLPNIRRLVDKTLETLGYAGDSRVCLCREYFDIRHYDTFSLPAGIYDSLRIVIGDGMGKNWWCISFPTLCIPATTSEFMDTAVSAGFSRPLAETLSGNEDYEIRFFLLDQLGKLEKILFRE